MELSYHLGRFTLTAQGSFKECMLELENQKAIELIKHGSHCGVCKSENVMPRVRTVNKTEKGKAKTYVYYEFSCMDCYAKLSLGQHQEGGTMFPKRKDESGNWLENNGWEKWEKPDNQDKPSGKKNENGADIPF